jgi:hypothetical protein
MFSYQGDIFGPVGDWGIIAAAVKPWSGKCPEIKQWPHARLWICPQRLRKRRKKKLTPFAMMLDRTRTPWTKARSQLNDGRIKLEPLVKCKKPGTV